MLEKQKKMNAEKLEPVELDERRQKRELAKNLNNNDWT